MTNGNLKCGSNVISVCSKCHIGVIFEHFDCLVARVPYKIENPSLMMLYCDLVIIIFKMAEFAMSEAKFKTILDVPDNVDYFYGFYLNPNDRNKEPHMTITQSKDWSLRQCILGAHNAILSQGSTINTFCVVKQSKRRSIILLAVVTVEDKDEIKFSHGSYFDHSAKSKKIVISV